MSLLSFLHWMQKPSGRPPSEREILLAGEEFLRKEQLIDRLRCLPPELSRAAKDAALNRFLEILFLHLRR